MNEWFAKHYQIAKFLIPFESTSQTIPDIKLFLKKREGIHNLNIKNLTEHLAEIRNTKNRLTQLVLGSTSRANIPNLPPIYDKQQFNTTLKKLTFAYYLLIEYRIQFNSKQISSIVKHESDTMHLIGFFQTKDLIPINTYYRFNEEFLTIEKDQEAKTLEFQIESLENYIQKLTLEIKSYPKPLYALNFPDYFKLLMVSATSKFDKIISYVLPFEIEVSLSRYIFTLNHLMQQKVDKVARLVCDTEAFNPQVFVNEALQTSSSLVPNFSKISPTEQSLGLMFFFRVIFDRAYEFNPLVFFTNNRNNDQEKLFKLGKLAIKHFQIPTGYKPEESSIPIRDFFLNDHFFHESSLFLDQTNYITNPIDAIYYIHKALNLINKAAILRNVGKLAEPTIRDITYLLCFDDQFSLLIGVLLASDIPNFFQFADFIVNFSPEKYLCNSFQYALSAVKALSTYITDFDFIPYENEIQTTESHNEDVSIEQNHNEVSINSNEVSAVNENNSDENLNQDGLIKNHLTEFHSVDRNEGNSNRNDVSDDNKDDAATDSNQNKEPHE